MNETNETDNSVKKLSDEELEAMISRWSNDSEFDKGDNLASYDNINEAFFDEDIHKLHSYALQLRTCMTEIDSTIFSHIRNIVRLGAQLGHRDNIHALKLLKFIPHEQHDEAIMKATQNEVFNLGLRILAWDRKHST